MPLQDNSIGGFQFIALRGERVPPRNRVVTDDRPGVIGSEFTLLSKKGTPFSVISQVDSEDYEDAWETYMLYRSLIEDDAVEMIQGGISTVAEDDYKVKVIDVTPLRVLTIRGAVGNLQAENTSEGYLECRWDLIAVPTA